MADLAHTVIAQDAEIQRLRTPLPCGHPVQCDPAHNDPNPGATHFCGWCVDRDSLTEERDRLAGYVAAMREALLDAGAWYRSDTDEFHEIHRALNDTAATASEYEARIRADERGRVLEEAAKLCDEARPVGWSL